MDEILNPGTWAAVRGRSKSNNDMVASKLRDETEGFEPPFPLDEDLAKELDDERDAAHRAEELTKQAERRKQWRKRAPQSSAIKSGGQKEASSILAEVQAGRQMDSRIKGSLRRHTHEPLERGDENSGEQENNKKKSSGRGHDWNISHLSRKDILRIWAESSAIRLRSEDEKAVRRLLLKFNGRFDNYRDWEEEVARRTQRERERNGGLGGFKIDFGNHPEPVSKDSDARCRQVQQEIDRAAHNSNKTMWSTVLRGTEQAFPTRVLRQALEDELDGLLREQVYERERAQRFAIEDRDNEGGDDGEEEAMTSDSDVEAAEEEKLKEMGYREKIKYKESKRERREQEKSSQWTMHEDKFKGPHWVAPSLKGPDAIKTKAARIALNESGGEEVIGPDYCRACRSQTCHWLTCCDVPAVTARREVLINEMHYVRTHKDARLIESFVPLEAMRGGNTKYKRQDLLQQLVAEDIVLMNYLQLNNVDRELHDAHATSKEFVEVRSLHNYPTLLWVNNAKRSLERAQDSLVCRTICVEVVDDILEDMLEGWIFGEKESNYTVSGFVPSIKVLDSWTLLSQVVDRRGGSLDAIRSANQLPDCFPLAIWRHWSQ